MYIKGHAIEVTDRWEDGVQKAYQFEGSIYDIDELFAEGNSISIVRDTVYHHFPWEQEWEVTYPKGAVETFFVTHARMLDTHEWSHHMDGKLSIVDAKHTVIDVAEKPLRIWELAGDYYLDYVNYKEEDTQYHVTVYGVEREYGGPEDGGWWYNRDYVLESRDIRFSDLATFDFDAYAEDAKENFAYGDIYSMAGGRKVFTVIEISEGIHETTDRPHYE